MLSVLSQTPNSIRGHTEPHPLLWAYRVETFDSVKLRKGMGLAAATDQNASGMESASTQL